MLTLLHHKGKLVALAVLLMVLTSSISYQLISARNAARERAEKALLPYVKELYSLEPVREAPKKITSTLFMFRGDFSSNLYDVFALQKRATRYCDNDTRADGCDVRLPRNYKWGTLSSKLADTLELICKAPEKTDFYVKIDDDLIMSESKFDEVLKIMSTTDCQVAGGIARDYGFYWPLGQMYIFKRAILEQICAKLPVEKLFHPHEDIAFGSFLNSTDKSMFCNLNFPPNHWHRKYKDRRLQIKFFKQQNK
ncbi:hypothetical protein LPJ72_000518 [Coemansia sp. Benny D160-2]|nr:hypothetical protein LPJ72_000518 [Coemansia sp. Benny D160-2]